MFLSIDLDAFYCGVEEHIDPKLRGTAFCVVQKHCIATLSYPARELGLKKLSNAPNALKKFPYLRMVNGEDLSKYRRAGKEIFDYVQDILGGLPVERLGLEEMRFDISSYVNQSCSKLPKLDDLKDYLDDEDFMDQIGAFGATLQLGSEVHCPDFYFQVDADTWPPNMNELRSIGSLEAYVAGHLAVNIRDRLWLELGYSCSIGVGSSKNLAKMVGSLHKPLGVTILIPNSEPDFVKTRTLDRVPGFGKASREAMGCTRADETVEELLNRFQPGEVVAKLAPVLGEQNSKAVYSLLTGVDSEGRQIKAYMQPVQISVEESYATYCPEETWPSEIDSLCSQVISQALIDWFDDSTQSWTRFPTTLRVSCIFAGHAYIRKSKSTKYSWNKFENSTKVGSGLAAIALQLLTDIVSVHKARPRVINVALVS